ncbi:MAG: HAD-IB family phosphatase [Bdellovibrionales bacterium]
MAGKTLAIFDFDGTLVRGDTLWTFLAALRGPVTAATLWLAAVATAPFTATFHIDKRTAVKQQWVLFAAKGVPLARAEDAAARIRPRWLFPQLAALQQHAADDATIIIATGALDICMRHMTKTLPVTAILDTPLLHDNGVLTGLMQGNAVRGEKAARVRDYIAAHGPFDKIIGYGNLPHDRAMLDLCDEQYVI